MTAPTTVEGTRGSTSVASRYDVVIVGAGLAGLSLARHLLLDTNKTVLVLERLAQVPPQCQKVGEATVQVGGYYFSKVLDLEEHLLCDHFMKYNLRFFWRANGRDGGSYEDYSQSAIRPFSNIPSYQIDRNIFEAELLRINLASPRFALATGVHGLEVALDSEGGRAEDGGTHCVRFNRDGADGDLPHAVETPWVVDASGRSKVLSKRLALTRKSAIRHGASFVWVEGQIDPEKLTSRSRRASRLDPARAELGHLPVWLATNHFAGEGFWLWLIPLQGKTSLGLVYDREVIDSKDVAGPEKLIGWIIDRFPLMARALRDRRVLDYSGFRDFAYDCERTIHPRRWAVTGEAGRFSDPLYSPGGDLIAVHNTLIVDAIRTDNAAELDAKTRRSESLMRAMYEAYLPSYTVSYEVLGDQESYSIKYVWELTIYFGFYVFPFINDLLTEDRFVIGYLRTFAQIGPLNRGLQQLFVDYYRWKKVAGRIGSESPVHFDFLSISALGRAERSFYRVGVEVEEARQVLREQIANVEELARFLIAYVATRVVGAPEALVNARFVEVVSDLEAIRFDPEGWRRAWSCAVDTDPRHVWSIDPHALDKLAPQLARQCAPSASPVAEGVEA